MRITPACAGKSKCSHRCRLKSKDHPRVCGEKAVYALVDVHRIGSPPRVRGKVVDLEAEIDRDRITPACAGKSRHPMLRPQPSWDHPRVCGEKATRLGMVSRIPGSPPRVRGKVVQRLNQVIHSRITPACAGKRWPLQQMPGLLRDHPRVCGEKTKESLKK